MLKQQARPKLVRRPLLIAVSLGICIASAQAQYDAHAPEPIGKLRGAIVLHGGGPLSDAVADRFVELAGGKQAHIVVLSTSSDAETGKESDKWQEIWKQRNPARVEVRQIRSREEAERPEFSRPLEQANGVWLMGIDQAQVAAQLVGTPVERALQGVIHRGGVVGASGAVASSLAKAMIAGNVDRLKLAPGLDLVPGAILDAQLVAQQDPQRLRRMIAAQPQLVGLGVEAGAALVLRGRALSVIGESSAVACIAASKTRPERIERLTPGPPADLIALSRAAVARTQPAFPPEAAPQPEAPSGTLILVGGGGMPKGLMERFVELAGGADAEIVYLPCTEADDAPDSDRLLESIRRLGVKRATQVHTKDRARADRDQEFLTPLKTATGILFGGGRQWNLVDSYQHTTAHKLIHDVLARGGVIAGSSAGASIQGDYMPRGDPLGNLNIIAEGYERGLGLLCGVAVDQHFTQRKRHADMTLLMKTYPQLLGIGLDEATALIVQKSTAEVVGANRVHFYDYRQPPDDGEQDFVALTAGQRYDLKARKIVEPQP